MTTATATPTAQTHHASTEHQALAVRATNDLDRYQYEPETRGDAYNISKMIVGTPFCPKGLQTAEAVTIAIMYGRELGFSVMQTLRLVYVVNGRPSLSSAAKAALCQQSPECEYLQPVELSPTRVVFETKRKGHSAPTRMEWTIEMARNAGLTGKDPWKNFPTKMLAWRATSDLCDLVYPDIVGGILASEDAADIPPEREVNPRPVHTRRAEEPTDVPYEPTATATPAPPELSTRDATLARIRGKAALAGPEAQTKAQDWLAKYGTDATDATLAKMEAGLDARLAEGTSGPKGETTSTPTSTTSATPTEDTASLKTTSRATSTPTSATDDAGAVDLSKVDF